MMLYIAACPPYSVLKFGLGVNFDAEKLKEAFGISVMGCVDLKLFAPKCGHR